MTPHFLFPSSPLNARMIDEAFQDQAIALKSAGYGTSTFSIEENRITGVVPEDVTIVYRGWMMNIAEYSFFYGWLLGKGLKPLTSIEEYAQTHHLPNWYPLVETLTPETLIFPKIETNIEPYGEMTEWKTTVATGWEKIQVKDYVKSLKTAGGSVISSLDELETVLDEMKFYRGEIEGGICLRRWEELRNEQRYFVINGKFYNAEGSMFDLRVMEILIRVARDIPSPFFSVDIAEGGGRFRIVEMGDGQVSDLVGWTPERFAEIWK